MNSAALQQRFYLVFRRKDVDPHIVWSTLVGHLRRFECCPPLFQLLGTKADGSLYKPTQGTPEDVHSMLMKRTKDGARSFNANTFFHQRSMDVSLRIVSRDSEPASFTISAHQQVRLPGDWKDMIESIASLYEVQIAIQHCWQYTSWQITSRKDLWDAAWGAPSYHCTEKKLPGIEGALVFFDVSKNPGRFSPDTEIPCHVAAEMWLGPSYWSYASCTKEEVLATDFFLEKRDTPHYLYLKSWPHPFTRPDGEQGRVQQKLWRLLYKQDCEWPPGSGGISDVPVGGPPELMP